MQLVDVADVHLLSVDLVFVEILQGEAGKCHERLYRQGSLHYNEQLTVLMACQHANCLINVCTLLEKNFTVKDLKKHSHFKNTLRTYNYQTISSNFVMTALSITDV